MSDFAQARLNMVDCQVRPNDVTNLALLSALLQTPRELFVAPEHAQIAYLDRMIPLNETGRFLADVMPFAKLVQMASLTAQDRVLDVGAGTGYSTAILARLCAHVTGLEEDAALAQQARLNLQQVNADHAECVQGVLNAGVSGGQFDVIIFEGSIEVLPDFCAAQLKEGGRVLAVVGRGRSGRATLFVKVAGQLDGRLLFDASLPPLPGFDKKQEFAFAV